MKKLAQKLQAFMVGRNGADDLYRFLNIVVIFLALGGALFRRNRVVELAALFMVIMMFRFFSRNLSARRAENEKYLAVIRKIRGFFTLQWTRLREFHRAVFRRCPGCRSMLRLPYRRGKHTAVCPRCGKRFDVRVLF